MREGGGVWSRPPPRSVSGATGVEEPPPQSAAPPVRLGVAWRGAGGGGAFFARRSTSTHRALTTPPTLPAPSGAPHRVESPRHPQRSPAPSGAAGSNDEAHSARGALGRGPLQPRSLHIQTVGEARPNPTNAPHQPPSKPHRPLASRIPKNTFKTQRHLTPTKKHRKSAATRPLNAQMRENRASKRTFTPQKHLHDTLHHVTATWQTTR
jgi:hypothetical protein